MSKFSWAPGNVDSYSNPVVSDGDVFYDAISSFPSSMNDLPSATYNNVAPSTSAAANISPAMRQALQNLRDTKVQMADNIYQMSKRGETLGNLQTKSNDLANFARQYKSKTADLNKGMFSFSMPNIDLKKLGKVGSAGLSIGYNLYQKDKEAKSDREQRIAMLAARGFDTSSLTGAPTEKPKTLGQLQQELRLSEIPNKLKIKRIKDKNAKRDAPYNYLLKKNKASKPNL